MKKTLFIVMVFIAAVAIGYGCSGGGGGGGEEKTTTGSDNTSEIVTSGSTTCSQDSDCGSGYICRDGTCAIVEGGGELVPATIGGTCHVDAECASGLICSSGVCTEKISDSSIIGWGTASSQPAGTTSPATEIEGVPSSEESSGVAPDSGSSGGQQTIPTPVGVCQTDNNCAEGLICQSSECVAVSSSGDVIPLPEPIQLSAPEFSKPGGVYGDDISVAMASSVDGVVIHYTLDEKDPTETSAQYSGPISISGNDTKKVVKARAFKEGMVASNVSSATYTISYSYLPDLEFTPTLPTGVGSFDKDINVEITSPVEGVQIFYTEDQTEPTPQSGKKYTAPIPVAGDGTVKWINAKAFKEGFKPSSTATTHYYIKYSTVATPQFKPAPIGTYNKDIQVTISSPTEGAAIYYTDDGSEPTEASKPYNGETIDIVGDPNKPGIASPILKVRAFKPGMLPSSIATGDYNIFYSIVAIPTVQPESGLYHVPVDVELAAATAGAKIYYTTDGSIPTKQSNLYTAPIALKDEGSYKIDAKAFVEGGGESGGTGAGYYTISYAKASTPYFQPDSGIYDNDISVTMATATYGATIHYTDDGSEPTQSSPVYSKLKPISIAGNGTVKTIRAKAFMSGMIESETSTAVYEVKYSKMPTPYFTPTAGSYDKDTNVVIAVDAANADIYYTTDGKVPTTSSNKYTGSITVSGDGSSKTIKAVAVASGVTLQSDMAEASYSIYYNKASTPQFSPIQAIWDVYNMDKKIEIKSSTAGAQIYYTEDGSTPTTNSKLYTGPITVWGDGEHVIKAKAFGANLTPSDASGATYKIAYKWYKVSTGGGHTCAIREYDNSLWCWGGNGYGELGFGDVTFRYKPEKVPVDGQWGSVSAGLGHTCAIKSDGTLWCWGSNMGGQLGLGLAPANVDKKLVPQQVMPDKQWFAVSAAAMHTCAIDSDLQLWCWGLGESGALGLGTMKYTWEPAKIGAVNNESISYWKMVETGANHTCAIKAVDLFEMEYDGSLWCWGTNSDYAIGISNPNVQFKDVPTKVTALDTVKSVSAGYQNTAAIDSDWSLWIWGKSESDSVPPQKTLTQLIEVSAGSSHVCGILLDGGGIIKCVGDNSLGQLGLGNTDASITSGTIADKLWESVSVGNEYSCAIEKYGKTLWCWGTNDYGQLGIGDKYPTGGVLKQVLIK